MSKMEFNSGAHRSSSEGRGNYDSIPPLGLERLALRCEFGDNLHGKGNWKKGIPLSSYINSALRHINNYMCGDLEEDHVSAASWNLLAMAHTEKLILSGQLPEELDDIGNVLKAKRELEAYATSRGNIKGEEESDSGVEIAGSVLHQDSGTTQPEPQNSVQVVQQSQQDYWPQDWGYSSTFTNKVGEVDQQLLEGSNQWTEWQGSRTSPEADSSTM